MNTQGHLGSNGGLRGHSVGDIFPYIVFAEGKLDNLKYKIRTPDGNIVGEFNTFKDAENEAKQLLGNRYD